jgi:hypothetical protein
VSQRTLVPRCLLAAAMFAMLMASVICPATVAQSADDEHVLTVIRQRLTNGARVENNAPFVFIGKIDGFGPIFHGVCKEGVNEEVDFSISKLIVGKFADSTVKAGYINCAQAPLPSPPFTQGAKLIVYCERAQSQIACLNPVAYSDARVHEIQRWYTATYPPIF